MLPNEELHDEIMQVFNQYFKAHQMWVTIQNKATVIDLRKEILHLKRLSIKLRKLCDEQRLVVQDWRYYHFSPRQPSKRAKELINDRDQKLQEGQIDPITKIKIRHRN